MSRERNYDVSLELWRKDPLSILKEARRMAKETPQVLIVIRTYEGPKKKRAVKPIRQATVICPEGSVTHSKATWPEF